MKFNVLLLRAVLPTGFTLLGYAAFVDHFRNPAIFSGAITLITLPAVHAATTPKNGNAKNGKDNGDEPDDKPKHKPKPKKQGNGRSLHERAIEEGKRLRGQGES